MVIRDKTADELAIRYGAVVGHGYDWHLGRDSSSKENSKRAALENIEGCYEFISRDQMKKRFPRTASELQGWEETLRRQ